MTRQWPWPGDAPVVRARKMALAYRHLAQEQQARLNRIRELFTRFDERVLKWEPDEEAMAELRKILEAGPADAVDDLDRRFVSWGEEWHADFDITYEPDDLVATNVAAKILAINENTIGRMRINGRLEGHLIKKSGDHQKRWYFYVRDLYAVQEATRTRTSRKPDVTDKLHTDGRSDPE